ncbi:hypothetical protein CTRI78_v002770 [Colletotrichum trifolii]|uniref:Allergen n=1 Tax=Colletotrichum trifolii TaxID=5466 RepID=A0A4R8RKT4_COLTR|nr:hypothetical protein CTRI78_v002770 [Colletotrichum trifolii]
MDKAKQAVSSFVSGDGHHRTTVKEDTNQAVTEEQVRPHRHENVTTAVDKEVHQDHHHTTVQPIKAKETLPEKHHNNVAPVTHKTIDHGDATATKDTLDREAAKFKNTSTTHETTHSSSTAPVVTGERVHHHVHEHIQPVIQKDTIQPHIVHTTVPIHETHHNKAIHHGTTTLPVKTLDEFNKDKGHIHGNSQTHEFDGCPDKYDKRFESSEHSHLGSHHDKHHTKGAATTGAAAAAAGGAAVAAHKHNGNSTGTHGIGHENHRATDSTAAAQVASANAATSGGVRHGVTAGKGTSTAEGIMHGTHTTNGSDGYTTAGNGSALNKSEPRSGSTAAGVGHTNMTTEHKGSVDANGKKISLVDKLNPFKDADGDGHKGIMS